MDRTRRKILIGSALQLTSKLHSKFPKVLGQSANYSEHTIPMGCNQLNSE